MSHDRDPGCGGEGDVEGDGDGDGDGLGLVPERVHFWLAPPLQVQMTSLMPLAVALFGTSRHLFAPTAVMEPSELRRHFWLFCPLQSQTITVLPFAVAAPLTSRHLLPKARNSVALVVVHCWPAWPLQS